MDTFAAATCRLLSGVNHCTEVMRAWVVRVCAVLALAGAIQLSNTNAASASAEGTNGWCTSLGAGVTGCFATPMDACQAQHDHYAPTRAFYGYVDATKWWIKQCAWRTGLGVISPATVSLS